MLRSTFCAKLTPQELQLMISALGRQYSGAIWSAIHPVTVLVGPTVDKVDTVLDKTWTPSSNRLAAFCVPAMSSGCFKTLTGQPVRFTNLATS